MAVLRAELFAELERMFTEHGRNHEQLAYGILQELKEREVLEPHFEMLEPILKSYVLILADETFTRGYRVGTPFEHLGELRLQHVQDKTLRASVGQQNAKYLTEGLLEAADKGGLKKEMQSILLEISHIVWKLSNEPRFGLNSDDLQRR